MIFISLFVNPSCHIFLFYTPTFFLDFISFRFYLALLFVFFFFSTILHLQWDSLDRFTCLFSWNSDLKLKISRVFTTNNAWANKRLQLEEAKIRRNHIYWGNLKGTYFSAKTKEHFEEFNRQKIKQVFEWEHLETQNIYIYMYIYKILISLQRNLYIQGMPEN